MDGVTETIKRIFFSTTLEGAIRMTLTRKGRGMDSEELKKALIKWHMKMFFECYDRDDIETDLLNLIEEAIGFQFSR